MAYLIVYSHNLLAELLSGFHWKFILCFPKNCVIEKSNFNAFFFGIYYLERGRYLFSWSGREVHTFYDTWGFM